MSSPTLAQLWGFVRDMAMDDQVTEGVGVTSLLRGESGGVFAGRGARHQNS